THTRRRYCDPVPFIIRIHCGVQDADVGNETGEGERIDASFREQLSEIGAGKRTVPGLVYEKYVWRRFDLFIDVLYPAEQFTSLCAGNVVGREQLCFRMMLVPFLVDIHQEEHRAPGFMEFPDLIRQCIFDCESR